MDHRENLERLRPVIVERQELHRDAVQELRPQNVETVTLAHLGVETTTPAVLTQEPMPKAQAFACPDCGEPLEVYEPKPHPQTGVLVTNPHKAGTGHCHRCGTRHPLTDAVPLDGTRRKVDRRGRKCVVCGKAVVYPRHQYCSDECAEVGYRERQAEAAKRYRQRERGKRAAKDEARRERARSRDQGIH